MNHPPQLMMKMSVARVQDLAIDQDPWSMDGFIPQTGDDRKEVTVYICPECRSIENVGPVW